jgi:hypothetical protein
VRSTYLASRKGASRKGDILIYDAARPAQDDARTKARVRSAHLADLEVQIGQQLNTKVHISSGRKKGTGTLSIDFYSLDQFDALLGRMGSKTE